MQCCIGSGLCDEDESRLPTWFAEQHVTAGTVIGNDIETLVLQATVHPETPVLVLGMGPSAVNTPFTPAYFTRFGLRGALFVGLLLDSSRRLLQKCKAREDGVSCVDRVLSGVWWYCNN